MTSIALDDAGKALAALAARVEGDEAVVTRHGRPVIDLVPHRREGGSDPAAGEASLRAAGIARREGFIADDFDNPLPEPWGSSSTATSGSP